jgi:hypothetical protein
MSPPTFAVVAIGALLVVSQSASATSTQAPAVICQGEQVLWIDPVKLTSQTATDRDRYEIVENNLYISPADRDRYLYNRVEYREPGRYASGHFTLMFSPDNTRLTLVLSSETTVKVIKATCRPRGKKKED